MNNDKGYEVLDMEPIKQKKNWSILLIIITVVSFLYVLLCVSSNLVVLISQFILVMLALVGCIINRKRKKVGILITVNIISLVIYVLLSVSMYLNYVNVHNHI